MTRARHVTIAAVALVLAAQGCGTQGAKPVAPGPVMPPQIVEVYPAHLSTGVVYDVAPIWARFAVPLDSTTVSARSVFLKIDDVRVPCSVRWEPATLRVLITPASPLRLRTVYTVVISTSVRTASGTSFAADYWWQFVTNSIRRIRAVLPVPGTTNRSIVTPLVWAGNDSTTDPILYTLWAGADSVAVAQHTASLTRQAIYTRILADSPWPSASTLWWTVRASNLATGEQLDSQTWPFTTLDTTSALQDSIVLNPVNWGYQPSAITSTCNGANVITNGSTIAAIIQWPVATTLPPDVEVESARLDLQYTATGNTPLFAGAQVWPYFPPIAPCGSWAVVRPSTDEAAGPLTGPCTLLSGSRARFASARLASQVEGMARVPLRFDGFWFRSTLSTNYPLFGINRPALVVIVRRPPAVARR